MEKYNKIFLEEAIELISGRDLKKSQYNDEQKGIPYIMGASNIKEGKFIVERWTDSPTVIGKKCDVILSVKGTVGQFFILEENEVHLSRQVMALRVKNGYLNEYIRYFLAFYIERLKEKAKGMIPGITREDILSAELPDFNLEIQNKIVNILKKAEAIINKRKVQIEALDQLIQSVFIEMFGDPTTNPKNWPLKRLGDYIKITGGFAFKSKEFIESGIPVIKIGTVNKGFFDFDTLSYVSEVTEKYKKYLVYPEDLLISLTGTVGKDDYGNVCIIPDDYEFYLLNQRVAKIEPFKNLDTIFLFSCFKQEKLKRELTKLSRGIRQANISNEDINNLMIPLPPIERQKEFSVLFNKIQFQKSLFNESILELENNYNSLLQRAFKGELFTDKEVNNL